MMHIVTTNFGFASLTLSLFASPNIHDVMGLINQEAQLQSWQSRKWAHDKGEADRAS
jgi:hypothetical protein